MTLTRRALMTLLVLAVPRLALACPVCFGQNDSPLSSGINLGIFAMLIVTGGVLVGFASFMIHLGRRARLAARLAQPEANGFENGGSSAEAGYAAHAQGGMV